MNLNCLGDQGTESNHSSYCARTSFVAFVQQTEKVVQFIERSKYVAKELNIKRWEVWKDELQKGAMMR